MVLVTSSLRQLAGLVLMMVSTAIFVVLCVILLPSRYARIRVCNLFGHLVGRATLWICGTTVTGDGPTQMQARFPAIYVSNHTSPLDIFLGIWLSPFGTCGVAKKEVVYYPFFGQLYWVSGHLRVDRGNHEKAVRAMADTAQLMKKHTLGVWIWPEGTRARDGRLLAFKKGFAHLALASGLPVVPVVVTGAHRGWEKGSFLIRPCTVHIQVLDPIPTTEWRAETLDQHIAEVRNTFLAHLPADQRPVEAPAPRAVNQ